MMAPPPMGEWDAALRDLDRLHERLAAMSIVTAEGGRLTAADAHLLSLGSIRATILHHWKMTWMEAASRPGVVVVEVADLPRGVAPAHGNEPLQLGQGEERHDDG